MFDSPDITGYLPPEELVLEFLPARNENRTDQDFVESVWNASTAFKAGGIEHSAVAELRESADSLVPPPELVIAVAALKWLLPKGLMVLETWLKAKQGRRVRIKHGDIEAEAPTVEEVARLVKLAEARENDSSGKQAEGQRR